MIDVLRVICCAIMIASVAIIVVGIVFIAVCFIIYAMSSGVKEAWKAFKETWDD